MSEEVLVSEIATCVKCLCEAASLEEIALLDAPLQQLTLRRKGNGVYTICKRCRRSVCVTRDLGDSLTTVDEAITAWQWVNAPVFG